MGKRRKKDGNGDGEGNQDSLAPTVHIELLFHFLLTGLCQRLYWKTLPGALTNSSFENSAAAIQLWDIVLNSNVKLLV